MFQKKKGFNSYKKYAPIIAIIGFIVSLDLVGVVDVKGKFTDILTSKAGSKAVDSLEGINLDALMIENSCTDNTPWGPPVINDEAVKSRSLYLCASEFASQFDPMLKTPIWTHEVLNGFDISNPLLTPQLSTISANELIPKTMQASDQDYMNSEYVPAFMASTENMIRHEPNDKMAIRKIKSEKYIKEAFLYTNTVPMNKSLKHNIWLPLDAKIRRLAIDLDKLYVISGPVYLAGATDGFLGESKVAIPTHFYKIVTARNTFESIAYIIPNKPLSSLCPAKNCTADNFIVTIKEVERVSGLVFYTNLNKYEVVKVKKYEPEEE